MHNIQFFAAALNKRTLKAKSLLPICRFIALVLITCFGTTEGLTAQHTNLDSLWRTWEDRHASDSARALALIRYAEVKYQRSRPDSAFLFLEKAYGFAAKTDLKGIMAHARSDQGITYGMRGEIDSAIIYFEYSYELSKEIGNLDGIAADLGNLGNIYSFKGDYSTAIDYISQSLRLYEQMDDREGAGRCLMIIGNLFQTQEDYEKAFEYYQKALAIAKESKIQMNIGKIYTNIGVGYEALGQDSAALANHFESLHQKELTGDTYDIPFSLQQIGHIYLKMGNLSDARDYLEKAREKARETGNQEVIGMSLADLSLLSTETGDYASALRYGDMALENSRYLNSPAAIRNASEALYKVNKKLGRGTEALALYESVVAIDDSLRNEENKKKILQQGFQYEFDKKEALAKAEQEKKDAIAARELQRQKLLRNGSLGGLAVMVVFSTIFFVQRNRIRKGKELSDSLLLNILPSEVAEELKKNGSAEAKHFSDVTVMFTDFKEFTHISESLTPAELVAEIDLCFREFDRIIERYGVEKIKTIGDAYMAAAGLPVPHRSGASDMVHAALDVKEFMIARHIECVAKGKPSFEMRIGLHSGPVVAGIVGVKKFQYDIWGDTVNTASRMESTGEVGEVNISQSTYEQVKDDSRLSFVSRGMVLVKGKGEMEVFVVERIS